MLDKVRRRLSGAHDKRHGVMVTVRPSRSLTRRTLVQVALRITVVVAIATVVSYWHVRARLEKQALDHLQHYVEQRRARESSDFAMAHANLSRFEKAYRQRAQTRPAAEALARFDELFEGREDGTTRLRRHVFPNVGITGMIGKYADLNDALKIRLVTAFELLQAFGPAWDGQFINLYVVTPDPAVLMYWPSEPWALDASDWEVHSKIELMGDSNQPVVVTGVTPDRKPGSRGWSELYFDYGANQWLISAVKTIEADGQSFMSVGHDLLLNEFIHRVLTSGLEGTYNLILDQNARLIAHPHFMEAILAKGGALPLQAANDAHLQRIYELARTREPHQVMVKDEANGEFLAVTQLEGPNWYLITVFPEAIVAHEAIGTARWILLFGILGLMLEIGILYAALRKQVARPLQRLMDATRRLGSGLWSTELPVYQDDEIGQLAGSFNTMAQEIEAREAALNNHNARLHDLNLRLERELEERQRAERELERQREFHALLDTIDYGVLMLAPNLQVRVYNHAYATMLGAPFDLLQNKPTYREILDFAHQAGLYAVPDDAWQPFVDHHLHEIGQPTLTRHEWHRADGRIFQVQSIPFPDGSRMLTYFDLTVLKETEAALLAAKEQAEQASQAKSTFLASMSHELRTPLNAIIGYGEMLLEEAEDKADAQLASDLLRIRNSGRHLLSLINDILDLSKIEAGRMELKLNEFALPPLLDDCMKTIEPIVDTDRVELIVCAEPDLPVLINDADKLRQVVINLLSNAAKFTHQGSITLRSRRDGNRVIIEVADTGVGIPKDMQTRIFEEFWQIEGSTTQNRSGTGLGLGISQKLAHLMGGTITLQSEVGVGSIFAVSIDPSLHDKASSQTC